MNAQALSSLPVSAASEPVSLGLEYQRARQSFSVQPEMIQRFLQVQAAALAGSLSQAAAGHAGGVSFAFPEQVLVEAGGGGDFPGFGRLLTLPAPLRRHHLWGGLRQRSCVGLCCRIRQRLLWLERVGDPGLALAARLLRHAAALHLVYTLLPRGQPVTYVAAAGEEIAALPACRDGGEAASGIEACPAPAAQRFYLPGWVAFDESGGLLVASTQQSEACLVEMQRYMSLLWAARELAPYIGADSLYQEKQYGMLGQIANQGRALALHQVGEIISHLRRMAAAGDLDRGLRLSLPYFDDRRLALQSWELEVTPPARIPFQPHFLVLAAENAQIKAADARLSLSTRRHLLQGLQKLARAFEQGQV